MSLMLNTGAMQYKADGSSGWQPLTLVANVDLASLADAFSESATYEVGEYVRRDSRVYRCITAVTTAGPWDSTKWLEVTLADEINRVYGELKTNLNNLGSDDVANDSTHVTGATVTDAVDSFYNAITGLDGVFKEFHFYYNSVSVSGGGSGTVYPNNITDLPSNYVVLGVRGIWTGAGNIVVRGYVAETGEINYTSTTTQTQTITANMLVLCIDKSALESFF